MGKMQREKGKRFERLIASAMREVWPDAMVRRSSQGERADNADVFVEHGPAELKELWLELEDAADPSPIAKLEQAERDTARVGAFPGAPVRWPVIIWHKLRARTIYVSMRTKTFDYLRTSASLSSAEVLEVMVTMDLPAFLAIMRHRVAIKESAKQG